jgi:glycosyltransferase involved in cell wall biosynthesis
MKICFISSLYSSWGGSEELWIRTANEALKKNIEVLISIYDWGKLQKPVQDLVDKGAKLHLRPNENFLSQTFSGKVNIKLNKLISLDSFSPVKNFNPDVTILSQGGTYDFTWQKSLGNFINHFNSGKLFILNQYNDEHKVLDEETIRIARIAFSKATNVFFVSKRNLESCVRQLAFRIPNASVVYNPIKTGISKISFPPISTITFAAIGRLEAEVKGQDILLHTLSSPKWKSRKWNLNFYGEGKDENYLKQLCELWGIEKNIHFKGFKDNVKDIWKENHFLVHPSFGEGTPLVLLEAMACGRTAVATDVGGSGEFIEDEYSGFLAKAPTVELFDHALEKAWNQQELLETFGERCLEKISMEFTTAPEIKLLDSILENRSI